MKTHYSLLVLGVGALMLMAGQIHAAGTRCAKRAYVVKQLQDRFGERVRARGLAPNTGIVELFASADTGTWTITITLPSGTTCLVAAGQAFEQIAEKHIGPAGEKIAIHHKPSQMSLLPVTTSNT